MRISDWSSDVCSSDLMLLVIVKVAEPTVIKDRGVGLESTAITLARELPELEQQIKSQQQQLADAQKLLALVQRDVSRLSPGAAAARKQREASALNARAATTIEQRLAIARQELTAEMRSEEHTSELQSLMRISYAVFCL